MNPRKIAQLTSAAAFVAAIALTVICFYRPRPEWIAAALALLAFSVVQYRYGVLRNDR